MVVVVVVGMDCGEPPGAEPQAQPSDNNEFRLRRNLPGPPEHVPRRDKSHSRLTLGIKEKKREKKDS